jgi:hypothetical protein
MVTRLRPVDVIDLRCCACGERVFASEHLTDPDVVDRAVYNASTGATFMCMPCCDRLWITLPETAAQARRELH